jgi:adenosine deaminase
VDAVRRDLTALPKAHLHLHLTGSMRPDTLRELAARYGVELPPELLASAPDVWTSQRRDWSFFQRLYEAARSTIRTPDDVDRVIAEAAAADVADGSVRLEIQVNPTGYAARFGLRTEEMVGRLVDACRRASDATGLAVGLVVASSWRDAPDRVEALARVAASFAGRGVVGFGLSEDDRRGRPADLAEAFAIARRAGLVAVPHSGYYAGPDHVRACVDELGARRIGHGIASLRDPSLLDRLARDRVTLEFCPTSYPPLGVVASLADVPLRQLFAAGVPVALAADDPLLFGVGLHGQYRIARDVLGFDDDQLAELARQSVRASTADPADQTRWLSAIDAWLSTGAEGG